MEKNLFFSSLVATKPAVSAESGCKTLTKGSLAYAGKEGSGWCHCTLGGKMFKARKHLSMAHSGGEGADGGVTAVGREGWAY